MKSYLYQKFAILLVTLFISTTVFADVKIKTRQTVSGRSSEHTTLIKGKRQRIESTNNATVSLMQCDLRRDVTLNPTAQTYLVSMFETTAAATKSSVQNPKSKINLAV